MAIGSIGVGETRDEVGRRQETSTATRSLYHPQVGHTVWGSFAALHRGHTLRDGRSSFHAAARWLRVFIFDFFFLGTATVVSLDEMGLQDVIGAGTPIPRRSS
jgi:hypothetical protein